MHRFFQLRRTRLLLTLLAVLGGLGIFLGALRSRERVGLRFLAYTNNGYARIALFEITNHSAGAVSWTLYADGRPLSHPVPVTEVIETDVGMRHIGSGGPLNLFGHDSLQFGTDALKPTEKKVWVGIEAYPRTGPRRQIQRLADLLFRVGWHRAAYRLKSGTRVEGTILP